MLIYNCTTNISETSEDKWLHWMQKTRIPAMLATGNFIKAKLVQVLVKEEMGGITYSVQYTCENAKKLASFYEEDANHFAKEAEQLFAGQFVSFETELDLIEEFAI